MTDLPHGVTFRIEDRLWTPENLVHTTETPGGLRECKFSLSSQGQLVEIDDRLVIYDSTFSKYPFVGRIAQIHKTGICFDFTAVRSTRLRPLKSTTTASNSSHPSGLMAGKVYLSGTRVVETLRDALQLCEDVFDGGIVDLAQQYVVDSTNMGGYLPEQMWNYVASIFSVLGSPLLWHIRTVAPGIQVVVIDFQDTAARYRVELPEDQIDENWDSEQIITGVAVEYGNDQIFEMDLPQISNARRKLIHEKYLNASNNGVRQEEAQGIAEASLSRFGVFTAPTTRLTMHCNVDIVQAKPPLVTTPVDNWPLHLVESGHGIFLDNRPVALYPYNEGLKYIVGTEYNWDSGELSVSCGSRVGGLEDSVNQITDYNVNRLFNGPYNGPPGASAPLADGDLVPQVGPEITGGSPGSPPSTSYATPAFKDGLARDGSDPNVPYGKQIDPDLIADEGLEANVNFDPATSGFQAAIRTTPGTYNEYRLLLGNAAGLVGDTVIAEFYRVIPVSENPLGGQQLLFQIVSGGLKDRIQALTTPVTLKRGDYAMIKVTTTGTSSTWAAVSLHAKKNFPRLKS